MVKWGLKILLSFLHRAKSQNFQYFSTQVTVKRIEAAKPSYWLNTVFKLTSTTVLSQEMLPLTNTNNCNYNKLIIMMKDKNSLPLSRWRSNLSAPYMRLFWKCDKITVKNTEDNS